ncbi:hypothetical protein RHMOL_Rhmol09G0246900 [Rhododendron molle]|uniref:Uncharacterized protein n=1 Tax=Rhododendron molle TaxID=49168 RepID=A0ACC0MID2_RHOML|nr:hypothetical protein RHMOL_Rhmol09G0246900 [Rhododendron molle]
MAGKTTRIAAGILMVTILIPHVISDDTIQIPSNKAQLNGWFQQNVGRLASRKAWLDRVLMAAEGRTKTITVRKDGSGDFRTVTDAVRSIPAGNAGRVIVWIGGGNYTEKIKIERTKPFVTFYGAPNDAPTLVFGGTAAQYGTVDSATLIVESDYFSAVNLVIANSAPRPDGKRKGAQAAALRISGDKAAFYNIRLYGFQDTICDDKGRHFFKDCYVEGTIDFIFGSGKSLYLNTELHVIPGDAMAMITAQARKSNTEDNGYCFVHCKVTGAGRNAFLGRAWMPYARVVYAYTDMSDVVHPQGWSDNFNSANDKTVYNAEYKCTGPGSIFSERVGFAKQLGDAEASRFINLAYLEGSRWLLPPHSV